MPEEQTKAELREAVGLMTMRFASVEFWVHQVAWAMMGDQVVGPAVTEQLTFDRLVELVERLAKRGCVENVEVREAIGKVTARLREVYAKRIEVTHAIFMEGEEPKFVRIRKLVRGHWNGMRADARDVVGVADECSELCGELMGFWKAMGREEEVRREYEELVGRDFEI